MQNVLGVALAQALAKLLEVATKDKKLDRAFQ
jgi:hypothetical protein